MTYRPGVRTTVFLLTLLSILPVLSQRVNAQEETKPNPVSQYKTKGYVSDFAEMIDPPSRAKLAAICKDLDKKKRTQMAIVTVASLDGMEIKDFATQLANHWGIRYKDNNRGILILLSRDDKQYRIAVGLGLESVLTDEEADRLGQEMVPTLRNGDYGSAAVHLAERIRDEIEKKVK